MKTTKDQVQPNCRFNKIRTTILIVLLGLSLICVILFWLEKWFNLNNPVTDMICRILWQVYPVWICVFVTFLNVLFACADIQHTYKKRKTEKKPFVNSVVYAGISLLSFVGCCITSDYIFGSTIMSV